jgi:hypothetical protein
MPRTSCRCRCNRHDSSNWACRLRLLRVPRGAHWSNGRGGLLARYTVLCT